MERPFICKCLTAEYEEEKSVLRGPVHIQFDIGKEQLFHVDIEQAVIRSIKISTDSDVSIFDLNTVLSINRTSIDAVRWKIYSTERNEIF